MSIFGIIGWMAVAALVITVVWLLTTFVADYRAAPAGSMWERALIASRESATILWTKLLAVGTALFGILVYGADLIGDPQVSAAIKTVLTPEVLTWVSIAVTIITAAARLRSLGPK